MFSKPMLRTTKRLIRSLVGALLCLVATTKTQSAPSELNGKWKILRTLPTKTISCWGDKEAKSLIGTEIEYSLGSFRWKNITTSSPKVSTRIVTADEFESENSGRSASSSRVTFQQLGITAKRATLVSIEHPPAQITGARAEIPGDEVLIKDRDSIVFSVCNIYFEAKRSSAASPAKVK